MLKEINPDDIANVITFMQDAKYFAFDVNGKILLAAYIHNMRSQVSEYKHMCILAKFFRDIADDLESKYKQGPSL